MATIQRFTAPKFNLLVKRLVEIPFTGTLAAGLHLTLVAGPIPYPFKIIQCKMIFTDIATSVIEHRWFTSRNSGAPATGPPSDENIFGRESPSAYFIGQSLIRIVNCNLAFDERNLYIKLHTYNPSVAVYILNCSIILQET
jgi:hypothetical protein